MQLFIAEKPSLGRAIAEHLGITSRQKNYITCGSDTVTWCFGHMFELCDPEDYDPSFKYWNKKDLPIIPSRWKLRKRKDAAEQLEAIANLLRIADSVVHAGDPDREGQLLVDEVLEHFAYTRPVKRIWLASLDARSIDIALANLKSNNEYRPLRDAARARSYADWLVGMNATRAMTLLGRSQGRSGVLSLGRVQTPTLNLVVTRDIEIAAFKPHDYFVLQAQLEASPEHTFTAIFIPAETQLGLDSEGRLLAADIAQQIVNAATGQQGHVVAVERHEKKKHPPLPHCLSSLQKAASAALNMTAQQVLDTAQSLYEKKLTTYPRTDCRYLPTEQFEDASRILAALTEIPAVASLAQHADAKLQSGAWNTGKITAHHAIIPTGEHPSDLSKQEEKLYEMIVKGFCLQFYAPLRYESQKITVNIHDYIFVARGRAILNAGWTLCSAEEEDDETQKEKEQNLPGVAENDSVLCCEVLQVAKKTTPPPRFTEGTLIEAMANIHRFVADSAAKAMLKENEGIGTEATRAKILETLKKRNYLEAKGKAIVSSEMARQIISMIPNLLKDPVTTAKWESKLNQIASSTLALDAFMTEQVSALPDLIHPILQVEPTEDTAIPRCPTCQSALLRHSNTKGTFWGCSAYPSCTTTLPDINGQPVFHPCPLCGRPLFFGSNKRGSYWACFNKERHTTGVALFLQDNGGSPVQRQEEAEIYTCPQCGKPLRRRTGTGKKGPYDFWGCTGYPNCQARFNVLNNKPQFD